MLLYHNNAYWLIISQYHSPPVLKSIDSIANIFFKEMTSQ